MGVSDFTRSTAAPADWPEKVAWPPFQDGPTFTLEPRARTNVKTGARYYAVNASDDNVRAQVSAYGADGAELRTFSVRRAKDDVVEFSVSNPAGAIINGSGSYTKTDSGYEARATINGQVITIRGNPKDPSSVSRIGEIRLTPEETALVTEFSALGDSIRTLGQSQSGATTNKYSCSSCRLLLAAFGVGLYCCALANPACCVSVLITIAVYDENCPGSCPKVTVPGFSGATS